MPILALKRNIYQRNKTTIFLMVFLLKQEKQKEFRGIELEDVERTISLISLVILNLPFLIFHLESRLGI